MLMMALSTVYRMYAVHFTLYIVILMCAAVILRYNLISFVYLLFLVVLFLLPGPRLKSQKGWFLEKKRFKSPVFLPQ